MLRAPSSPVPSAYLPPNFDSTRPVALIAGRGLYPAITAAAIRAAGVPLRLIAMDDETEPELKVVEAWIYASIAVDGFVVLAVCFCCYRRGSAHRSRCFSSSRSPNSCSSSSNRNRPDNFNCRSRCRGSNGSNRCNICSRSHRNRPHVPPPCSP